MENIQETQYTQSDTQWNIYTIRKYIHDYWGWAGLLITDPLWGESTVGRWISHTPYQGPVKRKVFPCHDVVMIPAVQTSPQNPKSANQIRQSCRIRVNKSQEFTTHWWHNLDKTTLKTVNEKSLLVKIMDWCWIDDKPLSEPVTVRRVWHGLMLCSAALAFYLGNEVNLTWTGFSRGWGFDLHILRTCVTFRNIQLARGRKYKRPGIQHAPCATPVLTGRSI